MPRYVVLEHDHPELHWDFMLECGDQLRTWRLAAQPGHGLKIAATLIFYHRRMYLDYEGPLSGDRGRVAHWDGGMFAGEAADDERVAVQLTGTRLKGEAVIERKLGGEWEFTYTATSGPGP